MRDRVVKEKALPFEPLDPNAKTIRAMKEARKGKFKRFERGVLISPMQSILNSNNAHEPWPSSD